MSMVPMTVTYQTVLTNYRNTVNQRFSQGSIVKRNRRAEVRSTTGRHDSTSGRGFDRRGGGCGSCGGRGGQGGRGFKRRDDDWEVKGINGKTIYVHPAYQFENEPWFNLPEATWKQLIQL